MELGAQRPAGGTGRRTCLARLAAVVALTVSPETTAYGQARTDVVWFDNGDRLTGEVVGLERGRLGFKTDDAGTLYLEWDKLVGVVSTRVVEVLRGSGRRSLGSLGPAPSGSIAVVTPEGVMLIEMSDVTLIRPIGGSFWRKLDGSVDAGFSYTRSSGIAQLNLNSDTVVRRPASQAQLTASLTLTQTDDGQGRDDRGTVEASYRRYPWRKVFIAATGRFETNESLGLELRSQIGAAVGPRLINSNRGHLAFGGGLAVNDERGVDVEPTKNVEGVALFRSSYYIYDRPRTNLDIGFQYFPSLSTPGRQRLQLDASVKREFWKDLFLSVNLYNSYDNRPPNPSADTNDVGVFLSVGWSY